MEPLIYYPTFEPPDLNWLKFALLYFENFKPIVPYNRRSELTDDFKKVINQSDLVTLYSPDHEEGHRASLLAVEEANKILENPIGRSYLFKNDYIIRDWQRSENWTFKIYEEKFSFEWLEFCENNRIGKSTKDGVLLPEELAFIFMSYLAKEIAFKESAAIITDDNKFDSFTNFVKLRSPSTDNRMKFAKNIVSLVLPGKIDAIPIEIILDFRRRNRELIRAFNYELDNVQISISHASDSQKFIDSYNITSSAINSEIIKLGFGVLAIPFGIYTLVSNPHALSAAYVREVLSAIGFLSAGTYALHKGLRDNKTKRYCKKYLINLKRLG